MGLFKKVIVNGAKMTPSKVTDLAMRAADSIMLTGFSSTEELYSLLKVNCMGSDAIVDEAIKELANIYNTRAAKDSDLLHKQNSKYIGLRDSLITNIVLMDDKLKMLADVRSYIAMKSIPAEDLKKIPIIEEPQSMLDASSVISSIAAAVPDVPQKISILKENK